MCGIAGHIDFSKAPLAELVGDCVSRIKHRGPDHKGLWSSDEKQCVLGHARLSIIDLSELGNQPMVDIMTGNCIVYNGEVYNFQYLRKHCESLGEKFHSSSDTETILAMYRLYGIEFISQLRGMFAFALWDEKKKCLFLVRDRSGKKPLNYFITDKGLIFCSEINALSKHPEVTSETDHDALELYLQLGYIPAPWTIYKKIKKIPPAHFAIFDKNGFSVKRYWEIDYRKKIKIKEMDAIEALEEKLTEAVKLRMISDVPIGALLSGGVDSSIIVALMSKISGTPINTYSIGFIEESFNELPYANQAAEICGTIHHTDTMDGNVEALLPKMVKHYGEPYADSSAVPSFFVCEAAKKHVKVALNGDGGDELLGGYSRNLLSPMQLKVASLIPNIIPATKIIQLTSQLADVKNIPLKAVRKFLREYAWPELSVVPTKNEFWNNKDRAELLEQKYNKYLLVNWIGHCYQKTLAKANNPIDRMLYFENYTTLPGDLLVKMDIASMSHGLELRSPFLDHEVIEFCAQLPYSYKVNNGTGKYILKIIAEKYFPSSFVYRSKMGFRIPLTQWLRGELKQSLTEVLYDNTSMYPLNSKKIFQVLDEFLKGKGNHESRIWSLYQYGLWNKYKMH